MATLEKRTGPRGDSFRLVFWINSKRYSRKLDVTGEQAAKTALANAVEQLTLYLSNKIAPPPGADLAAWITTSGRVAKELTTDNLLPLGSVFEKYAVAQSFQKVPRHKDRPITKDTVFVWRPIGTTAVIEPSTLLTVQIHLRHFTRILGADRPLGSITFDDLQRYIDRRKLEKKKIGKQISAVTLRKEIVTLSSIWTWATNKGTVNGGFPGKKLKFPATTEAPRFQTWKEIERQIKNGGDESLWDCLFLSTDEIAKLLAYAHERSYKPYVYPMLLTAAHTGARRSELIRSQAEDIDFKAKVITIRERKRERGHHGTRSVPMSLLLAKTLKKWLAGRTSGPTFQWKPGTPLTKDEVHTHLEFTLDNSKWSKLGL